MMESCSRRPAWRELADHNYLSKIGEEQLAKELMTISVCEAGEYAVSTLGIGMS